MRVSNAKEQAKIFYGLHFAPGVAEYREPDKDAYRILINEDTIRKMNPTFTGRPVFVDHVDSDELKETQEDGWVVESFFNEADGKTWVKFIVTSDRGHNAIKNGWKLSNAYLPQGFASGGVWHGLDYQKEVTSAKYEHLAIVQNPRYDESIILDAEQFKKYNSDKKIELEKVANSKGETSMNLNFFKRTKVENSADLENTVVVLPKSKVEKTITQLVNEADAIQNMAGYANGDHHVKVGEDEMTVNDLVKKHMDMCNEMAEMKKPKDEEKKENVEDKDMKKENEDQASGDDAVQDKKDNADEDMKKKDEKKENEEKDDKEMAKKNAADRAVKQAKIDAIKNADKSKFQPEVLEMPDAQVARGKARYGK